MIDQNCVIAACISFTNQASSLRKVETRHIHWKYSTIAKQIVFNIQANK